MDSSTRIRSSLCACLLSFALAGCNTLRPESKVGTKTGTELAVEAIQPDLLQECEGMPPTPANTVGDLLADGTQAMTLLAECMARHSRLIQYLRPVVDAERKRIPQ